MITSMIYIPLRERILYLFPILILILYDDLILVPGYSNKVGFSL